MKKLWNQNRVLFMLIIILIVCFVAILIVALTFFYSKNVSNYGSRLDGIDDYPITEKFKDSYKETVLESKSVKKVSITIKGRIIYINIKFDDTIELEDAKTVAINSLDLFEDDILKFYDIEFNLTSDNFTIFGAKNAIIDHVSWNNNREVVKEEEETDEK